ncbi:23202_t:CDS:1, partial [Dentiscutata erythropus]
KKKNREHLKNLRKQRRIEAQIARDNQAKYAGLPWHILEINKNFKQDIEKYANWPQLIDTELPD